MAMQDDLKNQLLTLLHTLPEEALPEVAMFLDYQRYKLTTRTPEEAAYKPVALGGIWDGIEISDADIHEVRREMWGRLEDREL